MIVTVTMRLKLFPTGTMTVACQSNAVFRAFKLVDSPHR